VDHIPTRTLCNLFTQNKDVAIAMGGRAWNMFTKKETSPQLPRGAEMIINVPFITSEDRKKSLLFPEAYEEDPPE
jgi:hypothetical protein